MSQPDLVGPGPGCMFCGEGYGDHYSTCPLNEEHSLESIEKRPQYIQEKQRRNNMRPIFIEFTDANDGTPIIINISLVYCIGVQNGKVQFHVSDQSMCEVKESLEEVQRRFELNLRDCK